MTLGASFDNFVVHHHLCVFLSNMEKSLQKSTKENVSDSLSLDHRILDDPSSWSRCDSFSSCSNDSAVYCSSHHIRSASFKVGKHLNAEGHAMQLTKRNRNSSGSSVSSNLSCISDKDNKKLPLIISPNSVSESSVCNSNRDNATDISILSCSEISSNGLELKHETILNEHLSCTDRSSSISSRHNLRRNIRKKTCSCDCSATCTTVVFRRYKEIGKKTVKEKTVISSTKVKTFIQKSPEQNMLKLTHSSSIKPESGRKRRSEVEKLYDSLHEIEWAKNFSPDNILRQINIRQAASCSVFGRPSANLASSEEKLPRKLKVENKSYTAKNKNPDSVEQKSERLCKMKQNFSDRCSNKCTRMKRESHSSNTEDKLRNVKSERKIVNNGHISEHSDYSNCSKSSVSIKTCSVARINLKKYLTSNDLSESKHGTKSFMTVNNAEYFDDAHLSSASDESSTVSGSTVDSHTKNFSDFDFKRNSTPESASTASNVTESTISPLFFDITEQGLLTMGACFREVGAEVVVSTCQENEHELPLLTSIKDTVSNKIMSDDGPPVLEPCVDITNRNSKNHDFRIKKLSMSESTNNITRKKELLPFKSNVKKKHKNVNTGVNFHKIPHRVYKSRFAHRRFINPLVISAGKEILKKYFKYIHSKGKKLYHLPSSKSENSEEVKTELKDDAHSDSVFRTTTHIKSEFWEDPRNHEIPKASSMSAAFLNFREPTIGTGKNRTSTLNSSNQNIPSCKYPGKLIFNYTKNGSCISHPKKESVIHLGESEKALHKTHLVAKSPDYFTKPTSLLPSTYSSIKTETETKKHEEEHISRPPASYGFSCHYKSIRVNRNNIYTQVVLKVTRGKSIFLTIETLTELKDIVKRAGNDGNCQVLIVNGIGDSFCLGLDLKPLVGPRKIKASTEIAVAVKELIQALSDFRKPLVAVVNGSAFGLGMTLLNHADVTIASDKATFCMPYSYLGYIPEGGATLTLPQAVGSTVAMDLILRGRTLTAQEARSIGLISEVLEAKRLPHELVSRVKMIAQNSISALETTKAMLRMRLHLELQLVLENEVKLLPRMWLSTSCQDALQSALHSGILAG